MSKNPVILWFRSDLRLEDNPALAGALASGQPVIPIYIWSPEDEQPWNSGAATKLWLYHSLQSLKKTLHKTFQLDLLLFKGSTESIINKLIQETSANKIFCNRRYEPSLATLDQEIFTKLAKNKITVEVSNGNLLFNPDEIRNKQDGVFKVFTPYYKHCLTLLEDKLEILYEMKLFDRETLQDIAKQNAQLLNFDSKQIDSLSLDELKLLEPNTKWQKAWQEKMLQHFDIGEEVALATLGKFIDSEAVLQYQDLRDRPDIEGTSKLAPYLHFGEISPVRIWNLICHPEPRRGVRIPGDPHVAASQLLRMTGNDGLRMTEPYLRQLFWREFAFYTMHHFPDSTTSNLKKEFDKFPWIQDQAKLQAWQQGLTGYPIVDAGMRELWETGWMHNRVRMIVGSFLVKDLMIHWLEGAKWFWDTLFDADLANNSMGWQWVAGSGVDASPFFRIFNPMTQGEKFDPDGIYVRKWIPELSKLPNEYIHKPFAAPPLILEAAGITLGKDYPLPIVNHDQARKEALAALKMTK